LYINFKQNSGIIFFEQFFGFPFPFSKYDMIFCPEYNQGAMENPGAVSMNDQAYIFKN
jgi:aminopeptidase N